MREFSSFCNLAVECALKAGVIVRQGFGTKYAISQKPGVQNYVTEFDRAAESLIIETVRERYPDHGFLAEESGPSANWQEADVLWVIDPLDGTTNFAHHIPIFSTSIAVMRGGETLCGVIYQPMTQELFVAEKGRGAFLNDVPISVSSTSRFAGGIGATGFPRNMHENPLNCIDSFIHVLKLGTLMRNFGSSAINIAYVAAGKIDAYWAISLYAWDIAAGKLLVEEAGGRVSSYQGGPYEVLSNSPIVASNGLVHDELLSYLKPG
ncbi:MAG: inositol monophosphatase [Parachlamydia sp.]|nr:inositol monophosphatase [Parachlamydia sp.]